MIIDGVWPLYTHMKEKEQERLERYKEVKRKLESHWQISNNQILMVIGALGTIGRDFRKWTGKLQIENLQIHAERLLVGNKDNQS